MGTLLTFIAGPIGSYLVTRVVAKAAKEHGGKLWFKALSVVVRMSKPEKSPEDELREKLQGVQFTDEQRALFTDEQRELIDH